MRAVRYSGKQGPCSKENIIISPAIVDKIINLIGESILRGIISNLRSVHWYAIIADEATNISGTEQLSVLIRWVDEIYEVHEDILGVKILGLKQILIFVSTQSFR